MLHHLSGTLIKAMDKPSESAAQCAIKKDNNLEAQTLSQGLENRLISDKSKADLGAQTPNLASHADTGGDLVGFCTIFKGREC